MKFIIIEGGKSCDSSATKTARTLSRSRKLTNGSVVLSQDELTCLNGSIQIAKGTLATLLLGPIFHSTRPSLEMTPAEAHSRSLLQELMDEVWKMETLITTFENTSTEPSGKR